MLKKPQVEAESRVVRFVVLYYLKFQIKKYGTNGQKDLKKTDTLTTQNF